MSSKKQKQAKKSSSKEKSTIQPDSQATLKRWLALIVAAFAIIQYLQTINYHFALDDYSAILENNVTRNGIEAIPEIFKTSYRYGYPIQGDELYRPIPKSVFAVLWQLSPQNATPFHLLNIVLYTFTGFLVFVVFSRFIPKNLYISFAASLLFVAHPIHTEVVANIKSVDEILSFLFFILSLYFLQEHLQSGKRKWLWLVMTCYFSSLLSKESAITFLAVYPLVIFFFSDVSGAKNIKTVAWLLIPAVLFLLIRYKIVGSTAEPSMADNALMATEDWLMAKSSAIYILGLYLKMLLFPHPLTFDYSIHQIPLVAISDWRFLLSFFIHAGLLIYALLQIRKKDVVAFGILFYFITISISSNLFITIGTHMAERLLYAPSFGYCFVIAALLNRFIQSKFSIAVTLQKFFSQRILLVSFLFLIVVVYTLKTWSQNPVWKNNEALYESGIHRAPESFRTHYYLGLLLTKKEHYSKFPLPDHAAITQRGLTELRKSIAIYPEFTDSWLHIGNYFNTVQQNDSAFYYFQKCVEMEPGLAIPHNNIGTIYFQRQQWEKAISEFNLAIRLDPGYHDAYRNLGSVYGTLGKYREAISYFQKAVELAPNSAETNYYLGITYQSLGDQQNAQRYLNRAAALDTAFKR